MKDIRSDISLSFNIYMLKDKRKAKKAERIKIMKQIETMIEEAKTKDIVLIHKKLNKRFLTIFLLSYFFLKSKMLISKYQ